MDLDARVPTKIEEAVSTMLRCLGEDPGREGLVDTPARMAKSMLFLTSGYREDAGELLSRVFQVGDAFGDDEPVPTYDGIVLLRDIETYSLCEHHLLPFIGRSHVAYIPSGRVVGISKLARVVDCFARRLQTQERLTAQVADAVASHLDAEGVLVVVEAEHLCMRMRGVGKQNSVMVTSAVRGVFREDQTARAEAMALLKGSV